MPLICQELHINHGWPLLFYRVIYLIFIFVCVSVFVCEWMCHDVLMMVRREFGQGFFFFSLFPLDVFHGINSGLYGKWFYQLRHPTDLWSLTLTIKSTHYPVSFKSLVLRVFAISMVCWCLETKITEWMNIHISQSLIPTTNISTSTFTSVCPEVVEMKLTEKY